MIIVDLPRRPRPTGSARLTRRLAAGAAAGFLLVGCGGGSGEEAASSSSEEAPSSSSSSSSAASSSPAGGGSDLSAGLLPAEAFGPGAQVTELTEQQLAQGASVAGGSLADATITPEACVAAVQGTQPDVAEFEDLAAQVAVAGTRTTVQLLASGGPELPDLAAQVAACPQAQVTSPQVGTVTITMAALELPDLGDATTGASFTTSGTAPDGSPLTVPAMIGAVQDGDRLVTLLVADPQGGALDAAAFATLLEQAYTVQAEALD